MSLEELYQKTIEDIKKEFPKFEIISKENSWLMKCLGFLLKLATFGQATKFMSDYITTMGYKVYVPSQWDKGSLKGRIGTLRHEAVHMRQYRKLWILFPIAYMLLFLPIGMAYFRALFEKEAYTETLRVKAELNGVDALDSAKLKEFFVSKFVGPDYGWMFPLRGVVEKWFDDIVKEIKNGK